VQLQADDLYSQDCQVFSLGICGFEERLPLLPEEYARLRLPAHLLRIPGVEQVVAGIGCIAVQHRDGETLAGELAHLV